ncbi:ATP-binding cassette domain-containing protein [Frankia sp. AgB1.9]|uniref:ABC transporter ATP-binding protein n=1 Tax=unclassified Frankia TaxID=2632575 RepID=UPI00193174EF|nr:MULTISPECIES: ATP-binding cassette domain-containing protein [unclassified Frankia]MBL7552681.1 ATP-binding cassette domain-containing protein [Frankia sp. AgB1.9]MBL7623846.1 ATP-binding cassette domain-containing protein [Frankia sp. AgB1.8]
MGTSIEVDGLHKRFGGTMALDGMTFTVSPGRVTGFVGPNGAGKSTTMRVVLGLDTPDAGTALVGGRRYATLPRPLGWVGALLDAAAPQPGRSARNHLLWLAHSQGLGRRRVDEVLDIVGLAGAARRKAGGYSLGMRQRLGIAAALLGDPPVLMFDEPFNGMDPQGIVWMRGFLRSLADGDRTVLVSSHLMSELQDTADHLLIVGRGRLIADTSTAALLAAAAGDRVRLRTSAAPAAATALERAGGTVVMTSPQSLTISGVPAAEVVAILGAAGVPFAEVAAEQVSLERAYLDLTSDAVEYAARPAAAPPGSGTGPAVDGAQAKDAVR